MTQAVLISTGCGGVFPMAAQLSKGWKGQPQVRLGHGGPGKQVRAPSKVYTVKSSGDNNVVNP